MTAPPRTGRVAVLGLVLLALVAVMELAGGLESSRQTLQDGFGPEGGISGRGVRLLRQLGVLSGSAGLSLRASDAPSSIAVEEADLVHGQWLVSIAIPEESLNDPRHGILANPNGRGREWERVGWVSFYDGRRLVFATRIGLRAHGSSGRSVGREAFRVIFRPSYGLPHVPAGGPLETQSRPPDRFVVRRHQAMPQAQPIAFELARRIGAIAPSAASVRFVLNGRLRDEAYELTEHVSREGWGRAFFGHDDFRFYQFRASRLGEDDIAYAQLREWVASAPAPLRLEEASAKVDIEKFGRHLLAIMYCGTEDWAQGAAVLDLRAREPRWFWVHWDMDQSFMSRGPEPWKRPSARLLLAPSRPGERDDARAQLFQRLLEEDPRFSSYFTELAARTINHSLTHAYLEDLVTRNERLSVHAGPFGGFDLGAFFARRGDEVFDELAAALGQPRPHLVDVVAPPEARLYVDGHEYESQYRGRYFHGQTVTFRAVGSDGKPRGLWTVNGRESIGNGISVVVDRDTSIRLEGR